ncbi:hypothetical protein BDK51DRAFT_39636 [Blyttiomyces helicus]|uniref:BRCT domain-containing protein n=1 Tax=Blyttiomyces helicus TaxID=388810 RepID=A0A4P9WKM9_9FUNG|nr:hypothetical protein BDK51DRAFT_39636 [Blyttiomyces helicus]|eukprot:RKO92685.1 hypothetical protein BDK51DRAFT_39636 [Blyttiomyces helicus]
MPNPHLHDPRADSRIRLGPAPQATTHAAKRSEPDSASTVTLRPLKQARLEENLWEEQFRDRACGQGALDAFLPSCLQPIQGGPAPRAHRARPSQLHCMFFATASSECYSEECAEWRQSHRLTMSTAVQKDEFLKMTELNLKPNLGAVFDIRPAADQPAGIDGSSLLAKLKAHLEKSNSVGVMEFPKVPVCLMPATAPNKDILSRDAMAEYPLYAVGVWQPPQSPNVDIRKSLLYRATRISQLMRTYQWPFAPDFLTQKCLCILAVNKPVREEIIELVAELGGTIVDSVYEEFDILMVERSMLLQTLFVDKLASLKRSAPRVKFLLIGEVMMTSPQQNVVQPIWDSDGPIDSTLNIDL